jgi:large subunit ribosomal protein L49
VPGSAEVTLQPTRPHSSVSELEPLSYFVHRTPSQQLPVYQTRKKGGTLQQTRIQKITGRVEDLKKDLQKALEIEERKIAISPVNRHIVIKVSEAREDSPYLLHRSTVDTVLW